MEKSSYLIQSSGGDLSAVEKTLGFDTGDLSSGQYRIAFINDAQNKVKIPIGNKDGANENWLPGGFTSGGMPEATYIGSQDERDYVTQSLSNFFEGKI